MRYDVEGCESSILYSNLKIIAISIGIFYKYVVISTITKMTITICVFNIVPTGKLNSKSVPITSRMA